MPRTCIRRFRSTAWWVLVAHLAVPSSLVAQDLPVVLTQEVTEGRIERSLRQAATLHPYEEVFVFARTSGYAREIRADMGDRVEGGDVLAVLDLPEQTAELEAAEASVKTADARVKSAEATLTLRRAAHKLTESLFEKEGRTQFQLDEARAGLDLASAELDLARALRDEARARAKRILTLVAFGSVRSPFRGRVTRRLVDTGALVKGGTAGDSKPLFVVQRADRIRCRVEIPERDAPRVLKAFERSSLELELALDALPDERLRLGPEQLTRDSLRFAGEVHPESHHMLLELDVDNESGSLLPGMFGRITLVMGQGGDGVPLVANTAIRVTGQKQPRVLVVRDEGGRAYLEERVVKLGISDGSRIEVISGLSAGERVVVRGSGNLQGGDEVTARRVQPAPSESERKP